MKKLLSQPIIIVMLTVFAVLFGLSLQKTAQKSQVASENVRLLEEKTQQLTGQIELEKEALQQASTPFNQEKILRDELLLQKPGEYIIQIPNDTILEVQNEIAPPQKPWQAWWELWR